MSFDAKVNPRFLIHFIVFDFGLDLCRVGKNCFCFAFLILAMAHVKFNSISILFSLKAFQFLPNTKRGKIQSEIKSTSEILDIQNHLFRLKSSLSILLDIQVKYLVKREIEINRICRLKMFLLDLSRAYCKRKLR